MTYAKPRLYYLHNRSANCAEHAALMLRTSAMAAIIADKCRGETPLTATGRDGPYARFALLKRTPSKCVLPKENV